MLDGAQLWMYILWPLKNRSFDIVIFWMFYKIDGTRRNTYFVIILDIGQTNRRIPVKTSHRALPSTIFSRDTWKYVHSQQYYHRANRAINRYPKIWKPRPTDSALELFQSNLNKLRQQLFSQHNTRFYHMKY